MHYIKTEFKETSDNLPGKNYTAKFMKLDKFVCYEDKGFDIWGLTL